MRRTSIGPPGSAKYLRSTSIRRSAVLIKRRRDPRVKPSPVIHSRFHARHQYTRAEAAHIYLSTY